MTVVTGKSGSVKDGGLAVAEVREFSVSQTAETERSTAMGATWHTHNTLQKAWSASVTCWYDATDTNQNAFAAGASVTFEGFADKDTSGGYELSGTATVTERVVNSSYDGNVELTLSLEGNGALTESIVV